MLIFTALKCGWCGTRQMFVKYLALWVLLTSLFSGASLAADTLRDPSEHFFHQSFGDLREDLANAKDAGQVALMLMFENDDCPWCKKMKATVLNRSSIQDHFRKHFRILSIDTDGDAPITNFDGEEMAQKDFALKVHRARATPTFIFFDLEGRQLTKYIGSPRNAEEFLWLAEFVLEGHYKNSNFTKYKRSKRSAGSSGEKSS